MYNIRAHVQLYITAINLDGLYAFGLDTVCWPLMVQGGWASEGGAAAYLMLTLNHAAMVANAIHDNKAVPTAYLVHAFNAETTSLAPTST